MTGGVARGPFGIELAGGVYSSQYALEWGDGEFCVAYKSGSTIRFRFFR